MIEFLFGCLIDGLFFVFDYECVVYEIKIGMLMLINSIVYNGLMLEDFVLVKVNEDVVDFVFIGMLWDLKGLDFFIEVIYNLWFKCGIFLYVVIVGEGVDEFCYCDMVDKFGLFDMIKFMGFFWVCDVFKFVCNVVILLCVEVMFYIILEMVVVQCFLIVMCVGGILEIFGCYVNWFIELGNISQLMFVMEIVLDYFVKMVI